MNRIIRKLFRIESYLITLIFIGENIMSKISDFAAAQSAFNDQMDAAITAIQADVKNLDDQIAALQASSGTITPEDQALLDGITAKSAELLAKVKAVDDMTPPVVPTPTPAP